MEISPEDPALIGFQTIESRGARIGVVEASKHTGFDIRRVYYLYGLDADDRRGGHCHKAQRQFFVCLQGTVRIRIENLNGEHLFHLKNEQQGVLVPAGCWRDLDEFTDDTIVAVFSSHEYDEDDYIRDYEEFRTWLTDARPDDGIPYLPLERPYRDLELPIMRAMNEVARSGHYIGGPVVETFETAFADYCGVEHGVGCGNGLDAIALTLQAWDIGAGDEVVLPTNSFSATALAVDKVGATPVLVDPEPGTLLLSRDNLVKAITPRTRAVIPVHLFGHPVDVPALMALAGAHGLKVLEDACQAHGAAYAGTRAGALGHAAAFSFYPTKNLGGMGDGGMVVTRDVNLADKVRALGNYGSREKYRHEHRGNNSRLDPLQAAVLQEKLPHLESWNARRRKLAETYLRGLEALPGLELPKVPSGAGTFSAWHVFPVRILDGRRHHCMHWLKSKGIETNIHYPVPIHRQPIYQERYGGKNRFHIADQAASELLSLPMHPYLRRDEIMRVIAELSASLK